MSLPICLEIPSLEPFELPLPGGISIERVNLMEIVQPALAPLAPIFNVVDAVAAIAKCLQAIPGAFGPPPDPTILTSCLEELGEKLGKLLGLVPQIALPVTVVRLIDLAVDTLRQVRGQLLHLQQQMRQIANTIDRARELNDAGLMAIAQCAQANVEQEARNVGQDLASLGRLLGLIGLFLGLIGGPEIPDLSGVSGQPLDAAIAPIDALIEALQGVRSTVPIP